jgi:putative serine/threonine protein kinase
MPEPNELKLATILGTKYSRFITYPSKTEEEARSRVEELSTIGISNIRFVGSTLVGGIPVLGKGCVGIVVQATLDRVPVALKVRRMDADRPSLFEEGRLLRLANSVDVGPRLLAVTRNFLAMELIGGLPLFRWVDRAGKRSQVMGVLSGLLEDCFKLDAIGLDHGELSHAPRNVLVNSRGKGCIVDFESASTSRRVANVTSLIQYFLFGQLAKKFGSRLYGNRRAVLKTLSIYKHAGSVSSFRAVLETLGLS